MSVTNILLMNLTEQNLVRELNENVVLNTRHLVIKFLLSKPRTE